MKSREFMTRKAGLACGEALCFATSLGRAHCQVATLQEAFSVLFHETYFASIQRVEDDIKEYQSQRKKLDSRRYEIFPCIALVIR